MYREIKYEDIDSGKLQGKSLFIDVRSPKEYEQETIPGAINLPLFSDEEREIIGTEYVQGSISHAKRLGIEAACKKLPEIYDRINSFDKEYDNFVFFCARGGFRSKSIVSLFKTLNIPAIRLDGGYKGYRKYISDNLPDMIKNLKFVILFGNTGTGKTDILKELNNMGRDVLDLEYCANHRGSILGGVGLGSPSSQKMFESLVYHSLKNRKSDLVFTEGESKRIGRIVMPDYMFTSIRSGINVQIQADIDVRIENILKEYVNETDEDIIKSLNYLRSRLGHKSIDDYIELVKSHDYEPVIRDLMINYYDPMYEHNDREYSAVFNNENSKYTAESISKFFPDESNNF